METGGGLSPEFAKASLVPAAAELQRVCLQKWPTPPPPPLPTRRPLASSVTPLQVSVLELVLSSAPARSPAQRSASCEHEGSRYPGPGAPTHLPASAADSTPHLLTLPSAVKGLLRQQRTEAKAESNTQETPAKYKPCSGDVRKPLSSHSGVIKALQHTMAQVFEPPLTAYPT